MCVKVFILNRNDSGNGNVTVTGTVIPTETKTLRITVLNTITINGIDYGNV